MKNQIAIPETYLTHIIQQDIELAHLQIYQDWTYHNEQPPYHSRNYQNIISIIETITMLLEKITIEKAYEITHDKKYIQLIQKVAPYIKKNESKAFYSQFYGYNYEILSF